MPDSITINGVVIPADGGGGFFPKLTAEGPEELPINRDVYKNVCLTVFSNSSMSVDEAIGYVRNAILKSATPCKWDEGFYRTLVAEGKRMKSEAAGQNPNNFASESAFLTKLTEILDNDSNIAALWYSKLKTAYNATDFNDLKSKMPLPQI